MGTVPLTKSQSLFRYHQFSPNVLFPFQDPIQGSTLYLDTESPMSPPVCDSCCLSLSFMTLTF